MVWGNYKSPTVTLTRGRSAVVVTRISKQAFSNNFPIG